ncbi:trypsin-like serine protease [Salinivibrio costicola]|uniref:trypsin-like serine protease n=1 Tax=Salinivibrio costicola TaxID=51367 RepID=UPI003F707290
MKKLLAVSVLAALTTTQANAVSLGTDVDESDYRDYIVRFETQDSDGVKSTCGGLLVAGEYIVTAAHCVGERYNDGIGSAYNWEIDQGANDAIAVYQGVKYNANKKTETTYQVVDFLDRDKTEDEAYAEVDQVIAENPTFSLSKDAEDWTKGAFHYDIALLKLTNKVSQASSAAMLQSYTRTTDTWNVNDGDSFIFRGWGRDENDATPETMQQTEINIDRKEEIWVSYIPQLPRNFDNKLCTGDAAESCKYGISDLIQMRPSTAKSLPQSGDSGTPLEIQPNSVYALAKRTAFDDTWVQFTHLSWYLPSIADAINQVTTPTNVSFDASEAGPQSHTFAVQNLTSFDETLNPYIANDNGAFSLSGCDNEMLKPLESCDITVTVNDGAEKTDAILYLVDTNDTSLDISYKIEEKDDNGSTGGVTDGDDELETIDSDNGGGGSFGLWSLLALFGMSIKRRYSH